MDRNEISRKATAPQKRLLEQIKYCLYMISDMLRPEIEVAFEELEIGNTRFVGEQFVLLDVLTPYTAEEVKVEFKKLDSGFAILRFTFRKGEHWDIYEYSGSADTISGREGELDLIKFLIYLGGTLDPLSPYADLLRIEEHNAKLKGHTKDTNEFTPSRMTDYFIDGMK